MDDWGLFCEVNRRRRSRRGIRETTSNHPTVIGLWMYQCFGLSKRHCGQAAFFWAFNSKFVLFLMLAPAGLIGVS